MQLPNTFAELITRIHEFKDVAIEFKADVNVWESYPEPRMRAYMTGGHENNDEVGRVTFDYTKFDEYNKTFESSNYFDDNGNACLNSREANLYTPVAKEYVMLTDDPNNFMSVVAVSKYYEQYQADKKGSRSYTEYLEERLTQQIAVSDNLLERYERLVENHAG